MNNRMNGFALPSVLIVSVLVLLMLLFAYSAMTVNMQRYSIYHERKQMREDLKSAVLLYCHDSTLCRAGESADYSLFDEDGRVSYVVENHGLYEKVKVSDGYPGGYSVLVGRRYESGKGAAFWLCDRRRALSLAGDARIDGLVYMPLSGINYTEINSRYYSGELLPGEMLRTSSEELPAVDSSVLDYGRRLCLSEDACPEVSGGMDTLVCGRSVRVKSGFRGRVQIFASDSVVVESGAVMDYPSGIYVDSGERRPYVCLEKGSRVSGYVVVMNLKSDPQLRFPSFVQKDSSRLNGLLYVDGSCIIEGEVHGAAYVRDCFCSSKGNVFSGTLYDARIVRSDSLAFPIFMEGPYERKMIKKIH